MWSDGQTDRTNMAKSIVTFRNFANAPKIRYSNSSEPVWGGGLCNKMFNSSRNGRNTTMYWYCYDNIHSDNKVDTHGYENPNHDRVEQWNLSWSKITLSLCISCADLRAEIRFSMSPKLSEENWHSDKQELAVGRFIGAAKQITRKKNYSPLSVMTHSGFYGRENSIFYQIKP
jgi:hypothetical protein